MRRDDDRVRVARRHRLANAGQQRGGVLFEHFDALLEELEVTVDAIHQLFVIEGRHGCLSVRQPTSSRTRSISANSVFRFTGLET
jgi:hypothetical protein